MSFSTLDCHEECFHGTKIVVFYKIAMIYLLFYFYVLQHILRNVANNLYLYTKSITNNMKKFLLALVLIVPMVVAGCSGKSDKQHKIEEQINAFFIDMKNMNDGDVQFKGYDNLKLELSMKSDSLLLYSATAKAERRGVTMDMPVEFVYLELPNNAGELLGVNLIPENGSLVEMNDKWIEEISKSVSKEELEKIKSKKDELLGMTVLMYLQSPLAKVKHINTR